MLALWLVALVPTGAFARSAPRQVEIRWDFTATSTQKRLEVWVNCRHDVDLLHCSNRDGDPVEKLVTPSAEAFELKSDDRVTIVAIYEEGTDTPEIKYAVTGTKLDDKDLGALKKLVGAATTAREFAPPRPDAVAKAVSDPLIAGGKLTVTIGTRPKSCPAAALRRGRRWIRPSA